MSTIPTITRAMYMADKRPGAHDRYYGQFATEQVIAMVRRYIGTDDILASPDPHFNDIPLRRWDATAPMVELLVGRKIAAANGGGVSLSDCVCTAKAAAKFIRDTTTRIDGEEDA